MQHSIDTGAFTTVSGMVGGVVKAVSAKPVMMAITFGSITNVMILRGGFSRGRLCGEKGP